MHPDFRYCDQGYFCKAVLGGFDAQSLPWFKPECVDMQIHVNTLHTSRTCGAGQTCPYPPDSQFAESSMQAYQRDASIVAPGHGKRAVDENGLMMWVNQLTVLGGVLQIDGKSFFMGFQVIDEVIDSALLFFRNVRNVVDNIFDQFDPFFTVMDNALQMDSRTTLLDVVFGRTSDTNNAPKLAGSDIDTALTNCFSTCRSTDDAALNNLRNADCTTGIACPFHSVDAIEVESGTCYLNPNSVCYFSQLEVAGACCRQGYIGNGCDGWSGGRLSHACTPDTTHHVCAPLLVCADNEVADFMRSRCYTCDPGQYKD